MRNLLLIIMVFLLFWSCSQNTVSINPEDAQRDIRERWDQFIESWEVEDAKACAAMYQTDALNIPPESSIKAGRAAIEEFYEFLFGLNQSSSYTHTIKDLQVLGDQVLELGEFKVDWVRNDSTAWTYHARSMTHWEKGPDGRWEIEKFIFNNPPE